MSAIRQHPTVEGPLAVRCLCLWLVVLSGVGAARALVLDSREIGISRRIPSQGNAVRFLVPVINDSDEPWAVPVHVAMRTARRGEPLSPPLTARAEAPIEPKGRSELEFAWTPLRTGWHRIVFELPDVPRATVAELTVPVTARDLYFVWFGAPQRFRWCNVPTTVKEEDEAWWLRHGALPAAWKGGVCYKQWPVDRLVESWGSRDWIAIDEVGGPGPETDKFIEAWKQLKASKPDQWIAVWFMGAHHYWAEVKHLVDLFVPEIYLNYRGNHLGQYDAYLQTAREAGVSSQVIPGLGINQVKDKATTHVTVSPSRADVLRQVRYLKRTAPDLNGIGFFTSDSAAPGVAEYADDLCEAYYIQPLITVEGLPHPLRLEGDPSQSQRVASVTLSNVGGMDADKVVVEWVFGDPARAATVSRQTTGPVAVDAKVECRVEVAIEAGWKLLQFRIVPDRGYTILDGEACAPVVRLEDAAEARPFVVYPDTTPAAMPVQLVLAPSGEACAAFDMAADGRLAPVEAVTLPPTPGDGKREVALTGLREAAVPRLLLLRPGPEPTPDATSALTREGQLWRVATAWYTAELDVGTDVLKRLAPAGGMNNVLRDPWRLAASGHAGFGQPTVVETAGIVTITIPFDSAEAKGESQYVFLTACPLIRIARTWVPQQPLTIKSAGDRCGLFQKGGTFALQPGVGGPVRRGRLNDGDAYRDLLFGYLGSRPAQENADRAGWIDMSYADADGGLGVVIGTRWRDADTKSYDVTRLYDASDWLEVLYLWGKEKTFDRPQSSCIYLIPHRRMDFSDSAVRPPAQDLWRQIHADQLTPD